MKIRLLGTSGLRVSEAALGTMTFGDARGGWGASREDARAVFDAYADAGGNFIDTASTYQDGQSEEMVGEFVRADRDAFVVATKYALGRPDSIDPNASGGHRKSLVRQLETSLRRLGVDYIDLLWVHAWDGLTRDEEVVRALDDVVRAGKVLYVGFSDTPAWVAARSDAIAEVRGWSRLAALQFNYNLVERTAESELIPLARDQGMGMVGWGALASGLLTGKYDLEGAANVGRLSHETFHNRGFTERNARIVATLVREAADAGVSPGQAALAWIRGRQPQLIPLLGARTRAQLAEHLAGWHVRLDEKAMERLEAVTAPPLAFPGPFLVSPAIQALLHGGFNNRLEVRRRGL